MNVRAEKELKLRAKQSRSKREPTPNQPRAKRESGSSRSRTKSDSAATQPRTKSENSKKRNEINKSVPQTLDSRLQTTENKNLAAAANRNSGGISEFDASELAGISERLIRAAGDCLDNPANCSGLIGLAVPRMWLDGGCDLELDVIPTLEAVGKRDRGKRIRSWDYFTQAVVDAKARRERGLPPPSADGNGRDPKIHPKIAREIEARAAMRRVQEELTSR
jgi:hypothetical protein